MRWFCFSILFLTFSSHSAWAQPSVDDTDAAFYRKMIEEAKKVNTALTASNDRLAESLEGYRREVRLLRSDRDKFEAEHRSVAERVTQLTAQIAGLKQQASELYIRNSLCVQELTRIQRKWTTTSRPPENGTKP